MSFFKRKRRDVSDVIAEQLQESRMKMLNDLCKMSPSDLQFGVKSFCDDVMPVLENAWGKKATDELILRAVIASISCDYRFSRDEFTVAFPVLSYAYGSDITYESALQYIKEAGTNTQEAREQLIKDVSRIKAIDNKTHSVFLLICDAILAADGFISDVERDWEFRLSGFSRPGK